jgi:hypothetical protein
VLFDFLLLIQHLHLGSITFPSRERIAGGNSVNTSHQSKARPCAFLEPILRWGVVTFTDCRFRKLVNIMRVERSQGLCLAPFYFKSFQPKLELELDLFETSS